MNLLETADLKEKKKKKVLILRLGVTMMCILHRKKILVI